MIVARIIIITGILGSIATAALTDHPAIVVNILGILTVTFLPRHFLVSISIITKASFFVAIAGPTATVIIVALIIVTMAVDPVGASAP